MMPFSLNLWPKSGLMALLLVVFFTGLPAMAKTGGNKKIKTPEPAYTASSKDETGETVLGGNANAKTTTDYQPVFKTVDGHAIGEVLDTVRLGENTSPRVLMGFLSKVDAYPVDLPTVLKLAATQNLTVAQDREQVGIEKSIFYQKLVEFLPDIDGGLQQSRLGGQIQGFGSTNFKLYQTTIQPSIQASLMVWPGGKTVFDALSAHKRVNAARESLEGTYQEQLSRAAEEYFSLVQANLDQDVAVQGLQEAKQESANMQARFEAGLATKLDVMQAETQIARRQRDLIDAISSITLAEQALLNRLNLDLEVNLIPMDKDADLRQLLTDSTTADQLLEQARQHHPDLAKLYQELRAIKWEARSILSEAVPAVNVSAYSRWTGTEYESLALSRFAGFSVSTVIGDNLGLNIPTRWLEKHRQIKQKELETDAQIRTIEADIINAYINSRKALVSVDAARKEKLAAQESYRLASGRYKAGIGISLDVISAEGALNDARKNEVDAIFDYNRSQVRLIEAIGLASSQNLITGLSPSAIQSSVTPSRSGASGNP